MSLRRSGLSRDPLGPRTQAQNPLDLDARRREVRRTLAAIEQAEHRIAFISRSPAPQRTLKYGALTLPA